MQICVLDGLSLSKQTRRRFLSGTNIPKRSLSFQAVYNAEHPVRIRVVMLTTSLRPYSGIVDLFVLDPDGFVIRKWNSKELNVGVITQTFVLPEYPKVLFMRIR